MPEGIKFDDEKLDWDLLPMDVMEGAVKVLMHGAKKYSPDNWKYVLPKKRYYNACMRHLSAWHKGEKKDESGMPHLDHALCSLIFLAWHDMKESA